MGGTRSRPIFLKEADVAEQVKLGIKVDDGLQRVPITNNADEEIGVFYFRPTDIGILERYNRLESRFEDVLKPLENVSVGPDGEAVDPSDEDAVNALKEAESALNGLLNELFDGNFAEAFFGRMNPFSPVNGRFYCEGAIEAVGDFINAQFGKEAALMSSGVEKYTKKYRGRGRSKK